MSNKNLPNVHKSAAGDVNYGPNIAGSIIALAAKEIKGVASLFGKGIRMDFVGNTINVDVFINIVSGFSCPDVAFRIQENIKRNVETTSAYKIGTVNVNVMGVTFNQEEVDNTNL